MSDLINTLESLVVVQKQYIDLLSRTLNIFSSYMAVHPHAPRSSDEDIVLGQKLRDMIIELEKKYNEHC